VLPPYDTLSVDATKVGSVISTVDIEKITLSNGLRGVDVELGNKGVLISATQEITVFGVNKEQYSTDGFVAFPTDTLGTEYVLITWSADGVVHKTNEKLCTLIISTCNERKTMF
jgi:outer membrane protein W